MYCNTSLHDFFYRRYQYQNQDQYQCMNNNCNCVGNKDTCTCSSSTLSSCFCETYGNSIALTREVSPAYGCVLYNDTFICTGAQYRMFCNKTMHNFYYRRYQNQIQYETQCWNNNCNCVGNKDTCTCSRSTLSSCFCETYGNNITVPTAVSPLRVPQCELYNDTFICTGAQYRMYCNTRMHDFYYRRYQNQIQYETHCWNNNCNCVGNKDTCTCYSSTLSSCFCETYGNIIALFTAVTPVYDCVLYNDTSYICTGAQYRMYCDTSVNDFYYNRHEHRCASNTCDCRGNKDTCTCSSSTSSSCFCTNYGNSIPAAVSPVYACGLYNDTYICTGAQYRMYCNTAMHSFNYQRYRNINQCQYRCGSNNCDCTGNNDTCSCSISTLSSCFCETNIFTLTTISPTTAVPNITLPDECMSQVTEGCLQNVLDQIENITAQVLPVTTVMSILNVAFNASEKILESSSSSANPTELASYGNRMLKTSEKLISTLVKPTDTSDNVSIILPTVDCCIGLLYK
ncbi:adhesion G -coupled receptor E1-like protein [Labeo rohita]|nr:adhesion G -coupled receptor E1-like protein [Labeo rohita]